MVEFVWVNLLLVPDPSDLLHIVEVRGTDVFIVTEIVGYENGPIHGACSIPKLALLDVKKVEKTEGPDSEGLGQPG